MDGDVPPHADARARPPPRRGHAAADHHEAGRPGLAGRSGLQPRLLGRRRRARAPLRRAVALQRRERPQRPGLPEHRRHAARHRLQHRLAARRRRPGRRWRRRGLPDLGRHREPAAGREDGPRRRPRPRHRAAAGGGGRERARRLHQGGRLLRRRAGPGAGGRGLPGQRGGAGRGLHRRHHHGGRVGPDLPPGGDRPHRRHRRAGAASAASCATSTPAWAASSCPS